MQIVSTHIPKMTAITSHHTRVHSNDSLLVHTNEIVHTSEIHVSSSVTIMILMLSTVHKS